MVKKIIHSIIFIAGLVLILVLTSKALLPKDEVYNPSEVDRKINALSKEQDNSIDIILVGDSEVYSGYSPLQMYHENGFTAYVLGTYAQRLCDTYSLLEKMYKTQSPKVVAIETNCFFRFGGLSDETNDKFMNMILKLVPAMKYHSRLKMYIMKSDTGTENLMKGFIFRDDIIPYKGGEWMKYTEDHEKIKPINYDYIEKIVNLVKEHGSELIFITTPSPDCHSYAKHNAAKKIAEKYGITYYDFNFEADKIGIDWNVDTRDGGNHLNSRGAEKLSNYVGKIFADNYGLPDHREDEAYKSWDEAYEKYADIIKGKKGSKKQ